MTRDTAFRRASFDWITQGASYEYSYHFKWLGVPIIQLPADIVGLQEVIWKAKPELIVETRVARGGSMIFYASLLELIGGNGRVVGIDVLLEGSSTDERIVRQVRLLARGRARVVVILDFDHTHTHVASELDLYSPLVGKGGYIVVLDTVIELPPGFFSKRPWDRGNNPMTAVRRFLRRNRRFIADKDMDKLLVGAAPGGYLRCIRG